MSDSGGTRIVVFKVSAGGKLNIVCKNHSRILGEIEVEKCDEGGKLRADATFLLEWRDGSTWKAVVPATNETTGKVGTCTSEGLTATGTLTTGEGGRVAFSGLRVQDDNGNAIHYCLTETKAPDGMTLLAAPIYEGIITESKNEYHLYLKAVDGSQFVLPFTGSNGFMTATISILVMGAALLAVFFTLRKKTQNTAN